MTRTRPVAAIVLISLHYQVVFARNAGHCDRPTKSQTLPQALEWVWKGFKGQAFR